MKAINILKVLMKKAKLAFENIYLNIQALRMSGVLRSRDTYKRLFLPSFNKRSSHHSFAFNERVAKASLTFFHDLFFSAIAANLSIKIILGRDIINYHNWDIYKYSLVYALVCAAIFTWTDMHRSSWKFMNRKEVFNIVVTYAFANLLFLPLFALMSVGNDVSVGYLLLNTFISSVLALVPRLTYKMLWEKSHKITNGGLLFGASRKNIILLGTDDDIEAFLRSHGKNKKKYNIIGVLDLYSYRVGKQIHGYEILGTTDDLIDFININKNSLYKIDQIIVGEDAIKSGFIREFAIDHCNKNMDAMIMRYDRHSAVLNNITMDEILTTPDDIEVDLKKSYKNIHNKNVLIIGGHSDLVVNMAKLLGQFDPKKITIMNNSAADIIKIQSYLDVYNLDSESKVSFEFFQTAVSRDLLRLINPALVVFVNSMDSNTTNLGSVVEKNLSEPLVLADMLKEQRVEKALMVSSNRVGEVANASASAIKFSEDYWLSMNKASSNKFSVFAVLRFDDFVNSVESVSYYFDQQIMANVDLGKGFKKLVVNNSINEEILISNRDASYYILNILNEDADKLRRKSAKFMVRGLGPFNYKEIARLSIVCSKDKLKSQLSLVDNKDAPSLDRRYFSMEEKITDSDKIGLHVIECALKANDYYDLKARYQDLKALISGKEYTKVITFLNSSDKGYARKRSVVASNFNQISEREHLSDKGQLLSEGSDVKDGVI